MSEKQLYFTVNDLNGGDAITGTMSTVKAHIMSHVEDKYYDQSLEWDAMPVFTVTPIWMTPKEYKNMPEAND